MAIWKYKTGKFTRKGSHTRSHFFTDGESMVLHVAINLEGLALWFQFKMKFWLYLPEENV